MVCREDISYNSNIPLIYLIYKCSVVFIAKLTRISHIPFIPPSQSTIRGKNGIIFRSYNLGLSDR